MNGSNFRVFFPIGKSNIRIYLFLLQFYTYLSLRILIKFILKRPKSAKLQSRNFTWNRQYIWIIVFPSPRIPNSPLEGVEKIKKMQGKQFLTISQTEVNWSYVRGVILLARLGQLFEENPRIKDRPLCKQIAKSPALLEVL